MNIGYLKKKKKIMQIITLEINWVRCLTLVLCII